jgi:hypothetical protein
MWHGVGGERGGASCQKDRVLSLLKCDMQHSLPIPAATVNQPAPTSAP